MANYFNIADHQTGTTFEGMSFHVEVNGVPCDLDGASIVMTLTGREGGIYTLDSGNGITILGAGEFVIDKQLISWAVDRYTYEMVFTLGNGDIKKWIKGNWRIV